MSEVVGIVGLKWWNLKKIASFFFFLKNWKNETSKDENGEDSKEQKTTQIILGAGVWWMRRADAASVNWKKENSSQDENCNSGLGWQFWQKRKGRKDTSWSFH